MSEQLFDELGAPIESEQQTEAPRVYSAEEKFARALRKYVMCLEPVMFIDRARKKMLSNAAFNAQYNRVVNDIPSEVMKGRYLDQAAKYATSSKNLKLAKGITYRPGQGEFGKDGLYNMWRAPAIEPLNEKPAIFIEHMRYLIPNAAERRLAMQWLAWAVQHPNQKLMFALLLYGVGGTGKSWLGKMLEVIFGEDNVTLLEDDDPLKSDFQEFKLHKRMLVVNEIAPDAKVNLVSKLKGFITESKVMINQKGIARLKVENFCNLMGITNEESALKIARGDRRWLIAECAADVWGVDDDGKPTRETNAYYKRLFDCIGTPDEPGDEARRILHYLGKVPLAGFDGKSLAPSTDAKDDIAAANETEAKESISSALKADPPRGPFRFKLFTVAEVLNGCYVIPRGVTVKAAEATVSQAMIVAGCRKVVLDSIGKAPQMRLDDGKPVRVWARSKAAAARFAGMTSEQLKDAYEAERAADPEPGADDLGIGDGTQT